MATAARRIPLSDLQWNLGTVAKMSLGGDDLVEADDSAYVTIDDAEGAVCEINIEGQHAREVALVTAAAPKLLAALETINRIASPNAERTLIDGVTRDLGYITDIARAAIAKAEGR